MHQRVGIRDGRPVPRGSLFSKICQLMKQLLHVPNIILSASDDDGDDAGDDADDNDGDANYDYDQ